MDISLVDKSLENELLETPIVIKAPRALWLDFILTFFTLSLYSSFWFVGRTRELNKLLDNRFTPWLWFLVPFVALAQLFALPKFIRSVNELADENNIPKWKKQWIAVWVFACFAITVLLGVSDKIEFPGWFLFVAIFIWSFLMIFLQSKWNKVIQKLDGVELKGPKKNFTLIEWLFFIPSLLFTLFISYPLIIQPLMTVHLQTLEKNTSYIDEKNRFDFPVKGEGWSIVEIGTLSDGTAQVELQGPLDEMSFIVFNHGENESLNSISEWRISELLTADSSIKCNEKRNFAVSNKLSVVSRIECSGTDLSDPFLITISLIEVDKEIIELYGYLSAVKLSFFKHVNTMKVMAKGFEPL